LYYTIQQFLLCFTKRKEFKKLNFIAENSLKLVELLLIPLGGSLALFLVRQFKAGEFQVRSLKEYLATFILIILSLITYIYMFLFTLNLYNNFYSDPSSFLPLSLKLFAWFSLYISFMVPILIIVLWYPFFVNLVNHFALFRHTGESGFYEIERGKRLLTQHSVEIVHNQKYRSPNHLYKSYAQLFYINEEKILELKNFERKEPFFQILNKGKGMCLLFTLILSFIYVIFLSFNNFHLSSWNLIIIPLLVSLTFFLQLNLLQNISKLNKEERGSIKNTLEQKL